MFWTQYALASKFMPTAATDQASQVNNLYSFLLISSFIACVILIGGMIYFAFKYRRKSLTAKSAYITHNTFLEFLWSFIPLVIFLVVFAWGWNIYHQMRKAPENALEIQVTGKQWAWEAAYKSGVRTANLVKVPINTDVKIILNSVDVIHSFYVPSFRIKQDAVPGRYTTVWFNANKLGDFHIFCTEYCGTQHSGMLGKLQVVTQEEYYKWLEEESKFSTLPIAQKGEKLFQVKACSGCHSVADASVKVGPALFKKFGGSEELADGTKVTVDENYIRESILNPNAQVVKGFNAGVMPAFQGQISEDEVSALIEYIKSVK